MALWRVLELLAGSSASRRPARGGHPLLSQFRWAAPGGAFFTIFAIVYLCRSYSWSRYVTLTAGSYMAKMPRGCGGFHEGTAVSTSYFKARNELYDQMGRDFIEKGAPFLAGGDASTSQALKTSDIFTVEDGKLKPVHKALDIAVRANVLYIDSAVGTRIATVVGKALLESFHETAVWLQDPDMYHMSMFHASHHLEPVKAAPEEVKDELAAIGRVANLTCPLQIALDSVLVTSTGVLLGCWQLLEGSEPALLRQRLREHLPNSPKKQLYDRVMLHTSFARILGPPNLSTGTTSDPQGSIAVLGAIVKNLNKHLCGLQTEVRELWFVEEWDLLALALRGRLTKYQLPLRCPNLQISRLARDGR